MNLSQIMDETVVAFLGSYLSDSPRYQAFVIELWRQYLSLGLPNGNFVKELTSGKDERFNQRLWEMLLARHLHAQGHTLTSATRGPDLRFEREGRIIWVEAISPEPRGLPGDWMEPPQTNETRVGTVPHNEIVLRWTAAFKAKADKLAAYLRQGIVGQTDAYVIAIHGGQLGAIPLDHGVSRYPLALETVFPLGPLAVSINRYTGAVGDAYNTNRFEITNANGAPVATTPFVDPTYVGVSAVLAFSRDRSAEASLPVYVVHNPLARVRVLFGVLGREAEEWYAEPVGDDGLEMELRKRPSAG